LINEGFQKDVSDIREAFSKFGLKEASKKVSENLVEELAIVGSVEECKEKILEIEKTTKLKTVILGFDLPEEKYDDVFFEKLDKLLGMLK
jgi:alkanesulfonate monooxygenase SsuD/methylene tetrahydromethanopterin reductase-like flavin-dependent oxidoreductase (luciferase family)